MGRRKRNETEADDEEGKRLMERIHSTTCTLLINAQHGLCTVLMPRKLFMSSIVQVAEQHQAFASLCRRAMTRKRVGLQIELTSRLSLLDFCFCQPRRI